MIIKLLNLIWGISKKADGQMFLGKNSFDRLSFLNRKNFFGKLGMNSNDVVSAGLVHGSRVRAVGKLQSGKIIDNTDALVTNEKNIILSITVADCLPVYFYDPVKKAIGLAHAGWRGVLKNISGKTVALMTKKYQTDPDNILVHIGPHIKKCHFEVKEDVADQFNEYKKFISRKKDKIFIDLSGIVKYQLVNRGVKIENIRVDADCTYCQGEKYFSYRHDKKLMTMVAYIGLR